MSLSNWIQSLSLVQCLLYPAPPPHINSDAFEQWYKRVDGVPSYIAVSGNTPVRRLITILFCHGNGTDCDYMLSEACDMAAAWNAQIILWEYPGYGVRKNEGPCTSDVLCREIVALYDHIRHERPADRIVVYGHSVGTGPAVWLASQRKVDGLILRSPYTRICDVVRTHSVLWPLAWFTPAVFDNMAAMRNVHCPVLFLYGARDGLITPEHTTALATKAQHILHCAPLADHNYGWDNEKDLLAPVRVFIENHV